MNDLTNKNLPQFYLTPPAPCPYLEGKTERKIFTHLNDAFATPLNDSLTHGGFRRSQNIAYKPHCETCHACISVRVKVRNFQAGKSFKRIINANKDITGIHTPAQTNKEQYALLTKYLAQRHENGGMDDMTIPDYMAMVEDTPVDTHITEYVAQDNRLIGVALMDRLSDGLSMVYSFFDPEQKSRSLGTFMILNQIKRTQAAGLDYLYLGYWIEDCQKMMYKKRFQPLEKLTAEGWVDFKTESHDK